MEWQKLYQTDYIVWTMGEGIGTGIYLTVPDIDKNGWQGRVVTGKYGFCFFIMQAKTNK